MVKNLDDPRGARRGERKRRMFIARVTLQIRPSHRGSFRAYAAEECKQARALPGCVEYAFCEDVADPARVLLYEEWASREQFEVYRASPLFAQAGAHLGPMLESPPRSAYYESEDVFTACAMR
jgi:quinol monooxygenase YgiN